MGRLQPTTVVQPNAVRRSDRAKRARETVNKVIPDLLKSSPRARHGIHNALLVTDPPAAQTSDSTTTGSHITVRIRNTDTLTAARQLTSSSRRASAAAPGSQAPKRFPNVCILNMASPLRSGGGFLEGATSQEEFLCMRTTLYASLWDDFYRLPEVGGVVTPDVLVHRDSTHDAGDLPKRERFFVDVISAGMIRFPETNGANRNADGAEAEGTCSCGVSYCDRDRELVTRKMRGVLRMAQAQGAQKLILGAWGCGAYGNPVKEVAKIWKRVLVGTSRKSETWSGIREVVFAIPDRSMLKEFERCFADISTNETVSPPPETIVAQEWAAPGEGTKSPTADLISELVCKIQETELQLDQISNPRSKARLREVLAGLNKQLVQVGATASPDDEMPLDPIEESEEVTMDGTEHGAGVAASDGEENSYYNFDSSDIASSGSVSPSSSDIYEFKLPQPGQNEVEKDDDEMLSSSFEHVGQMGQMDYESGWFSGSINGLSALLTKPNRTASSPELRPMSSGMDAVETMDLGEYLRKYSEAEA
ncbi:hypothetical protein MBLNU459_g3249t1 [Dothideomycetes sp. NU459]